MLYTSTTSRFLPAADFLEVFVLGFIKSHCINKSETLRLLKCVISPYITEMKKQLQIACLNWDAFKSEATEKVKLELEHVNIKDAKVPKQMTHLLEEREFSGYFTTLLFALLKHCWLIPNKMLLQQKLIESYLH